MTENHSFFSDEQIEQIQNTIKEEIKKSQSPSKNEFDHDGKPTPKQEVEILKLLSLAIGYNAAFISSIISLFTTRSDYAFYAYLAAVVFLVYLSLRSSRLAFKALRGNAPLITQTSAKIMAFGVLASGFSMAFGVLLAFIVH